MMDPKRDSSLPLHARIEMVSGSNIKHIYDANTGNITVQRALPKPLPEPYNYGFLHGTLGEDGDELDVFVISGAKVSLGDKLPVKPIGVIYMEDENGGDDKIIATFDGDQSYSGVSKIEEINVGIIDNLVYYIQHNKDGLPGKFVKIKGIGDANSAAKVISESRARANESGKEK